MADEFDYIIIGAGSAGCVLANRLSEDAGKRILVLEAGNDEKSLLLRMPIGVAKVFRSPRYNWGYVSEPEPFLDGRRISHPRGKLIGGSSAINAMAYVRGHRADYDRLATAGLKGWSYREILPYFKRSESFEGGSDTYRGGDGPWHVRSGPYHFEVYDAFRAAGRNLGYASLDDYNGADQMGFAAHQHTIHRGRRCGNADAFLSPALKRANVELVSEAHVTKLLIERDFVSGVEYMKNGNLERVNSTCEVILSAGAYNSPQILMVSGIGDPGQLKEVGVQPICDLPGVGQNLWDHPTVGTTWSRKGDGYIHRSLRLDRLAVAILRGLLSRDGFACEHYTSGTAFVRSGLDQEVPDLQLFCRDGTRESHEWFPLLIPPAAQGISLNCAHVRPQSRGEIRLGSNDPFKLPQVVNNFLSCEADRNALREGYRFMRSIMTNVAMSDLVGRSLQPEDNLETDADIDRYVRKTTSTIFHPGGTCKMGLDEMAVVDAELRVRGVRGLRVVDASVMPAPIAGNINAAVTVFAERASDIIRGLPPLPAIDA
jgi:choline dehydrogenase-like flavoprotein